MYVKTSPSLVISFHATICWNLLLLIEMGNFLFHNQWTKEKQITNDNVIVNARVSQKFENDVIKCLRYVVVSEMKLVLRTTSLSIWRFNVTS